MKTQIEKLDRLIREIEMDEYLNEETLPKIREAKGLLNTLHEQCNIANVVSSAFLVQHKETLINYGLFSTREKAENYINNKTELFGIQEVKIA